MAFDLASILDGPLFPFMALSLPVLVLALTLLRCAGGDAKRFRILAMAIAIGLAGAIGFIQFAHGTLEAIMFIGMVSMYLLVLLWSILWVLRKLPRFALAIAFLFSVLAWCLPVIPIAEAVLAQDRVAARHYCEQLVPRLNAYRAAHGRYPAKLTELDGALPDTPAIAVDYGATGWNGEGYRFSFYDPTKMVTGWTMGENHEWIPCD